MKTSSASPGPARVLRLLGALLLSSGLSAAAAEPSLPKDGPLTAPATAGAKKAKAPPTAATYNARGLDLQARGDFEGAVAEYNKAFALDPTYAATFFNRANVLHAEGKFEAALEDYARCIAVAAETSLVGNYSKLFRYLVQRRLDRPGARADLTRSFPASSRSRMRHVARFLADEIPEADFAVNPPAGVTPCDVYYFIGMKTLLAGEAERGRRALHQCVATYETALATHLLARMEIVRLAGPVAQDWRELRQKLGDALEPLTFESVPEGDYPKIQDLAARLRTDFRRDPTKEEVEKVWREQGQPGPALTKVYEEVKHAIKREHFLTTNSVAVSDALRGTWRTMLQTTAGTGEEATRGVVLICVPLPCPNRDVYDEAARFMDAVTVAARVHGGKIYLVRSCYGDPANLKRSEAGNWWWSQIQSFPTRFSAGITSGHVKLRDALAGASSTPKGYLFRDGEFLMSGFLAEWDAAHVAREFAKH
jgi:tetratricopeptide (TPR) repeat protein